MIAAGQMVATVSYFSVYLTLTKKAHQRTRVQEKEIVDKNKKSENLTNRKGKEAKS